MANENILVYAHWEEMNTPILMGEIQINRVRGKEVISRSEQEAMAPAFIS